MLEVGNGLTDTESRAHFSLWALLNAPLLAGNDLRTMSAATRAILTNTEVIAVNQDWGGRQGNRLRDNGDPEVWTKPMSNGVGRRRAAQPRRQRRHDLHHGRRARPRRRVELLGARPVGAHEHHHVSGTISASVPAHGAAMYFVTGGGTPTRAPVSGCAGSGVGPVPGHHRRVAGQRRRWPRSGTATASQPAVHPDRARELRVYGGTSAWTSTTPAPPTAPR